jgi:2-polyprenyl-3-methyl-5-hydroxy-6-metoxy-1,4-benzoquinol methylase
MGLAIADIQGKASYLWWAATKMLTADTTCPACQSDNVRFVHRKYLVTSLHECQCCHIRFRVPKETSGRAKKLYTKETYTQGFTTDLPSPTELNALIQTNFAGTEKNFDGYIAVLKSVLSDGARILDFGSSWGYGSWQMQRAGFDVYSYEVGEQRAAYAKEHLGCKTVTDLSTLYGTIDCLFSSHVIEHLPNPGILLDEAQKLLVPGGYFICYCPNGNPALENEKSYHNVWGKVHPLFLTPGFMAWAVEKNKLSLCEIRAGENLRGGELLTIAQKTLQPAQA